MKKHVTFCLFTCLFSFPLRFVRHCNFPNGADIVKSSPAKIQTTIYHNVEMSLDGFPLFPQSLFPYIIVKTQLLFWVVFFSPLPHGGEGGWCQETSTVCFLKGKKKWKRKSSVEHHFIDIKQNEFGGKTIRLIMFYFGSFQIQQDGLIVTLATFSRSGGSLHGLWNHSDPETSTFCCSSCSCHHGRAALIDIPVGRVGWAARHLLWKLTGIMRIIQRARCEPPAALEND